MSGLSMATDYFLKIAGIPGESKRMGHRDEIELTSWSFGCSQAGTAELGAGMSASGRVSMNDFTFSKLVDQSSPKLLQQMFTGRHIDNAVMTARRIGVEGGEPLDYFQWEFTKLVISSHSYSGANTGEVPEETISFRFSTMKCHYREIQQGRPQGRISGGWDLKGNEII